MTYRSLASRMHVERPAEADLKTAVLRALDALEAVGQCMVLRHNSGTAKGGKIRLGKRGTPDIQVLLDAGRTVWLELKRPGITQARAAQGKTRIAQAAWRAKAERLSHRVYVVQSVQDALAVVLGDAR